MTSVLYVASEAYPLAKTGGLGDVAGAFPAALAREGIDARIMLPVYQGVLASLKKAGAVVTRGPSLQNVLGGHTVQILRSEMPGTRVPLLLVDCPSLYARGANPYCGDDGREWADNDIRFALLSRTAAILAKHRDVSSWRPDIVHANDWHTGLVPYYLRQYADAPRSVFTIHNMAYQGLFAATAAETLGIRRTDLTPRGAEFWGRLSLLKAGLVYADRLTTVSPTYAQEIREPGEGKGLEGVLKGRNGDLVGILNGIDETVWDPTSDPHIAQTFDATNIALKADNKAALRRMLNRNRCSRRHRRDCDLRPAALERTRARLCIPNST